MRSKDKDAVPGRQAVRFTIPEAFVDGTGLIIEVRAFEMGPNGGRSREMKLSSAYWRGLLPKLVDNVDLMGEG